ncbi:golgin subfamily B member 1 isoform X2 [Xenopus laevis]|uniref:Golgin subfamily B member 1 isoform X2 n=1 Tax=Xenopus laevis TaxID=8355 RepID=A0A8J0UX77_XENLA|nr:golgin subfamily B member 1 isoform X2 [Xenopus laevis]
MFSRLSGIANTVLHELSGDGEGDGDLGKSVMESASQEEMSEDQMERLAHYEQLVVQLKELIQQKDTEIEQRDAQIKLERETSDAKMAKLKLQAKAKVANLNKQLEELKKTSADNKVNKEGSSDAWHHDQREEERIHEEERRRLQNNVSELTQQLQESQETVSKLTRQLYDSQDSFGELTRQLHESQQTVEQLQKCQQKQEAETLDLQQKLEEQCETLRARTQFVEMLEQELQSAEFQKQVLSEQFRQMETELKSLDGDRKEYAFQVTILEKKLTEKDNSCERLLKELEQESGVQQELEKMKTDMEQMKKELEKGQEAHKELEQLREELKRGKVEQDKLEQMEEQLKKVMEDQGELVQEKGELSRLKYAQQEIEQTERVHEELERMKEELEQLRGYQIELEQVRNELEREKGVKEELEKAKEELCTVKAVKTELNERKTEETLYLQQQNMERPVTKNIPEDFMEVNDEQRENMNLNQEYSMSLNILTPGENDSALSVIKNEYYGQMSDEMSKTETEETPQEDEYIVHTASENVLEPHGELLTQVLNPSTVEKDGLDSVSEGFAIALGDAIEDMQKKQLSILMMDLRDTQEEIESLKGQLLEKVEELPCETLVQSMDDSEFKIEYNSDGLTDAKNSEHLELIFYEESSGMTYTDESNDPSVLNLSQAKAQFKQIIDTEESNTTCQALSLLTRDSSNNEINVDIKALNELVLELQNQVQTLNLEKEALVKRITYIDTDIKQMEYYGAQNILAEQVNSLENESKSKDLKITALQKDLDQLNLQMSEQDALLRLKEIQLCEKEENVVSFQEMLNLSQSKEVRLSEALAGNERENVLLQDLLSQKSASIINFEMLLAEKDQQLDELSHSLSDKVVLLNEEKHSLCLEIKILQEQLISVEGEQKEDMEHSDTQQKESEDIRVQLDQIIKEKAQLQDMMDLVQQERDELLQQLEVTRFDLVKNQEMLHRVQEELHLFQIQLQEGTCEHLQTQEMLSSVQRENEELEAIVKSLRQDNVQQEEFVKLQQSAHEDLQEQLQKLTETQLHNADTIHNLQREKSNLENELHFFKSRSLPDFNEPKEKEEMQQQLELQKNELDHLKKKLQAALINRKELLKKVSVLEKKLIKYNTEPDSIIVESTCQQVTEQNTVEVLKLQLSEMQSDLERARREMTEKQADEEKLQTLIEEMSLEMSKKDNLIETLHMEKSENLSLIERLTAESQNSEYLASVPSCEPDELIDTRVMLENKIINLEQEKDHLQKKIQEALNSRRDTIKKAQEKDRHHREQLKQQKDEYNLLQEKYEEQQKHNLELQGQLKNLQEIEPPRWSPLDSQNAGTQTNVIDQQHSKCGVEFINAVADEDLSTEITVEALKQQLGIFEQQRDECELRAVSLEEDLKHSVEQVLKLQETIEDLNRQLQHQKENCQEFEAKAASLKKELDKSLQDCNKFQLMESKIKEKQTEISLKQEEINGLQMVLEERNEFVKNLQMSILEKDEMVSALKSQLEHQAKENKECIQKFEKQILEVQQKQDEDVEVARNKNQLQRKLQAALISRKEALKESKSLQLELDNMRKQREELSNHLRMAERSVFEISEERDNLLDKLLSKKEELNKLIGDVDKSLADNKNLEDSCESLKLALAGITHEKEILKKELESMKNAGSTQQLEWQEKLSDQQKEYESLLQSYENVSNEMDRMNRALEAVRQEKQEIFHKMKSMESAKIEVEKQLEDVEQELENMKDKMRKYAKSKQQKILDLEEENEKLRGELQPSNSEQILQFNKENEELKAELERLNSENCDLVTQLEVVKNENFSLIQQSECLQNQLQSIESKLGRTEEEHPIFSQDGAITTHESPVVSVLPPPKSREKTGSSPISLELLDDQKSTSDKVDMNLIAQLQDRINELENSMKERDFENISDEIKVLREDKLKAGNQISYLLEQISQLQDHINELENGAKENGFEKISDDIKVLREDKRKAETQISNLLEDVSQLQIKTEELKEINKKIQISEAKAVKEKEMTELEKDELEERLMNQLAELNGSIGNYQQDAMDLQIKNDYLQKELQDLQFELEEEKRKLEMQKAEALSHVQKEYVEKLKSVHQGEKGRERQTRELQELLKEKQQEVRHLQKDCIQFQETISGLERTVKALEFVHSACEKDKVAANEKIAKAREDTKKAKADLVSIRVMLDDTQSEAARVLAESMKLKESLRVAGEDSALKLKKKDEEAEKRLEHEREKHLKEMKNMQEKLDLLQQEKESMDGTITGLQTALDNKTVELKELRGNLNQNIAKLAAFTSSMCSLQDDRDRIIEESKKWNKKFSGAMKAKDNEMEEKEKICTSLKNELTEITSRAEELRGQVIRLEKANLELTTAIQSEAESHLKVQNSLLEEKTLLSSQLDEAQHLQQSCQEELKVRNLEDLDRQKQLDALETEIQQFKAEKEDQLDTVKRLELKVHDMKLHIEQTESDLQASKTLTEQLHCELEQKEQDVVRLLSSQDEAVRATVRELQELHAAESKELQNRLTDMEQERSQLVKKLEATESQAQNSQEDTRRSKTQLEAITKSMCSLQEERERLISDYQQLEQRHLSAILAKDSLIQEAAAESNELREELRFLLSRTDDLNAQNAKLNAQLARYREDLKELITLKDSQLKQLLGEKLQEIERLRQEQSAQEQQLKQEKEQADILRQKLEETRKEKQSTQLEVETLTLCVSKLQTEREAGEVRFAEEIKEVQKLKEEFLQLQKELALVKEEKYQTQEEAERRVKSAEEELQRKLQNLQHDTGIMRNEAETAEERVAELARDLMEAEQRLLHANEENSSLTARLQAFQGSMRSLQDSHDSAKEEFYKMQVEQKNWAVLQEELISTNNEEQQKLKALLEEQTIKLQAAHGQLSQLSSDLLASQNHIKLLENLQEESKRLPGAINSSQREVAIHVQNTDLGDKKVSEGNTNDSLLSALQNSQEEVQSLHKQLSDALSQVHHKELRVQQLNGKLSQIFDEKNALSMQLRGSSQNLKDALNRYALLEKQLQELTPKNQEAMMVDSAPGAPQEKKEIHTEADQQLLELQQRYQEMKQKSTEAEQVIADLERQLLEERQRTEDRFQEMEENMQRLQVDNWSTPEDPNMSQELSLLIEPQETVKTKARSSSIRRLLRHGLFSRTRTPLLIALYQVIIHVLLLLCVTGHL